MRLLGSVRLLFLPVVAFAQTEDPLMRLPTWADEMAKGWLPYHQLTVDDFAVTRAEPATANQPDRCAAHFNIEMIDFRREVPPISLYSARQRRCRGITS